MTDRKILEAPNGENTAPVDSVAFPVTGSQYCRIGTIKQVVRTDLPAAVPTESTGNPTANDDVTIGYIRGSTWINTTTETAFICVNPADGAAVWKQTTA